MHLYCEVRPVKPWLLNILACPICKEHPLTTYVLDVKKNRLKDKKGLAEELVVHYQRGILSEPSLEPVHNLSKDKAFDQRLSKARKVFATLSKQKPKAPDLMPLVEYFHGLEIVEGALRCEKCGRWFPVGSRVETIPELLPDAGRDKKADVAFLRKHREVLPQVILTGSKPFVLE
jgi:uncharacterized protein YbaR (Trm112 family)